MQLDVRTYRVPLDSTPEVATWRETFDICMSLPVDVTDVGSGNDRANIETLVFDTRTSGASR